MRHQHTAAPTTTEAPTATTPATQPPPAPTTTAAPTTTQHNHHRPSATTTAHQPPPSQQQPPPPQQQAASRVLLHLQPRCSHPTTSQSLDLLTTPLQATGLTTPSAGESRSGSACLTPLSPTSLGTTSTFSLSAPIGPL